MLLNVGKNFHAGCALSLIGLSETRLFVRRDFDHLSRGSLFFFFFLSCRMAVCATFVIAFPLDFTLPCILTIFRAQRAVSDAKRTSVSCTDVMSTLLALLEKV